MNERKSSPTSRAAKSEISATRIDLKNTPTPRKTPEKRREWRLEHFPKEVVVLMECDDRRKEAEARLPIRWGF